MLLMVLRLMAIVRFWPISFIIAYPRLGMEEKGVGEKGEMTD